jgi:hypothetical protein
MFRLFTLTIFAFLLVGCADSSGPENNTLPVSAVRIDSAAGYSFQVFEITDSTGASRGVGYDIYKGSKRFIHQVNIPGEPGNDGFRNSEEAARVATLVVTKLEAGGGFPTVTREELDSLNITLQAH